MQGEELKPSMVYLTDEKGGVVVQMPAEFFAIIVQPDGTHKLEVTFRGGGKS